MNHIHKLRTKLAILSVSLILTSAPVINGVLPSMKNDLNLTQAQTEILSTLPNLFVVISILLSSFMANKIGMKRTVSLGLLLVGIGGSLPILVSSYPAVILSRLILGAGLGLFNSLAISFISIFYAGHERASLLGIRNAFENIGQACLTLLAGLLLTFGWRYSFAVYLLAFPLILILNLFVPETKGQTVAAEKVKPRVVKEKIDPSIYGIFLFGILMMMSNSAILVRFPSMAVVIEGKAVNASIYLALMPLFGIIAGLLFGTVNRIFRSKTIYLYLTLLLVVNLLVSLAANHFVLLVLALFLSGVPIAWMVPHIFNYLGNLSKTGTQLNVSTSLMVVGFNLGGLLAPSGMQFLQFVTGSKSLAAPFPFFAILYGLLLAILVIRTGKHSHNQT